MDQPEKLASPFRWVIWSLFLTALNLFWASAVHLESFRRKGEQRTFGPSPPLIPEWVVCSVEALLLLQLALGAIAVWRVRTGRWWLGTILLALWLATLVFAESTPS